MTRGPLPGRLILLFSAYAPLAIIVGVRALPSAAGWVAIGIGGIGTCVWAGFLWWLPRTQTREVALDEVHAVDAEVTGYVVSLLLPIVAAGSPSTGDLVAYGLCAALLLTVAFAADLGAVNPLIYLFRLRVLRVKIGDEYLLALARTPPRPGSTVMVTRALAVLYVTDGGE